MPSVTLSASGGSLTTVAAAGGAAKVKFDGTYLAWIAKKGPSSGKAMLVLDGEAPVYVDLYAASYDRYKQKVYNTGLLPEGEHTLSIYWIGQRNYSAWSTRINIDAFEVFGVPGVAGAGQEIARASAETDGARAIEAVRRIYEEGLLRGERPE